MMVVEQDLLAILKMQQLITTEQFVDGNVEVSDEGGNVKLTLIGITDPVNIDEQLVLTTTAP